MTRLSPSMAPYLSLVGTGRAPDWTDLAEAVERARAGRAAPLSLVGALRRWPIFGGCAADCAATKAFFALSSPVEQYLLLSGRTLFKAMRFEDLLRLQFDIETVGLDSRRPEAAQVLMIALSTNRGASPDDRRARR